MKHLTHWFACLFLLALTACDRSTPGEDPRANPKDKAIVAAGAKVYAQQCAACHGVNLEGQKNWQIRMPNGRLPAPPHNESGHTWHHPDDVLFNITKYGLVPGKFAPPDYQSDMPAFEKTLKDDEIWAVLAYIKTSWKSPDVLNVRKEMLTNSAMR
jgi:mono/diheme cytochrome c family protein